MTRIFYKLELFHGIIFWAKENLTREKENKLFFATDNEGRTVFYVAADFCKLQGFQGIMNCAKKNLTREEVKK